MHEFDNAPLVRAAGGVLYRTNDGGELYFALVHKRQYDEWSLPKGKLKRHESWEECALREVIEETGSDAALVGGPAAANSYFVGPTPKIVVWFPMEARGGDNFTASAEIDAIQWLRAEDALRKLSHESERDVFSKISRSYSPGL
jgi:8-oxo-dGTP diphosphatase